jgi:hypothetical protein
MSELATYGREAASLYIKKMFFRIKNLNKEIKLSVTHTQTNSQQLSKLQKIKIKIGKKLN